MYSFHKTLVKMKEEVNAAVKFISKLIERNSKINDQVLIKFQHYLKLFLIQKFIDHWHPEKPWQGQGYRCLRVNGVNRKEPTIDKAASKCGLSYSDLNLPLELTVWVDPEEVCCRFGEHKGSYCTVASFGKKKIEKKLDEIDVSEVSKLEVATGNEENRLKSEGSKVQSSPTRSSSLKENISPESSPTCPRSFKYSPQNGDRLKHFKERDHLLLSNANEGMYSRNAFVYSDQLTIYNVHGNVSPPCYKTSSWIGYPTSLSPTHSYVPGAYFDYSPTHFSSQENLNMNRLSPIHINKVRWNSGPFSNGSPFPRHGWYLNREVARV